MKVLMVGQLPTEAGGTYTTGVCNVTYELSRCATKDIELVVYATNMKDANARIEGNVHYRGTSMNPIRMLQSTLSHPASIFRDLLFYNKNCRMSPIRYYAYQNNIERIIKEEAPDIIHCMNSYQIPSCYKASRKFNIPIILTIHGVDMAPQSHDSLGLKLADVVTGLTPEAIAAIRKMGGREEKLVMIPNGTDTTKFHYDESERLKLRQDLTVSDDVTVMLTVGSLSPWKGQYSFLLNLITLPADFKYLYLIIGKGKDEDKIRQFINDNHMEDKVKIIGYVNNTELYRYYSAADIYIHSSYSEGQALSEVEAYATDLKIALNRDVLGTVITDTSNTRDYWIFDFDTFDGEAFVKWAMLHKENRKTRKLYDWKRIFEMYTNIYRKLLNN